MGSFDDMKDSIKDFADKHPRTVKALESVILGDAATIIFDAQNMRAAAAPDAYEQHIIDRSDRIEALAKSDVDGQEGVHTALLAAFNELKTDPDRYAVMDRLVSQTNNPLSAQANIKFNLENGELTSIDILPSFWDKSHRAEKDSIDMKQPENEILARNLKAMKLVHSRREGHTELNEEQKEWLQRVESGLLSGEDAVVQHAVKQWQPDELARLTEYIKSDFAGSGLLFEATKTLGGDSVFVLRAENVAWVFNSYVDGAREENVRDDSIAADATWREKMKFVGNFAQENLARQEK